MLVVGDPVVVRVARPVVVVLVGEPVALVVACVVVVVTWVEDDDDVVPVLVAVVDLEEDDDEEEEEEEEEDPLQLLLPTAAKLAQVMRVVLAKCRTMLRLPRKAPRPERVEAKSSVKVAVKVAPAVALMLPCLPERSPTWQVAGRAASQAGVSPRWKGSRCARVAVQLPSEGTGWSWMW